MDGINLVRRGRPVRETVEFPAFIDADETEAGLSRIDVAVARAEITVRAPVGFRLPPARFVQGLRFLEDFELRHASSLPTVLPLPNYTPSHRGFCSRIWS